MSATVRAITNDALAILGEVAGAGVQNYSDDLVKADVIRAFNMLFKKRFWEQYSKWTTHVLDGVLGQIVAGPFGYVRDFEDFGTVCVSGQAKRLPILPSRVNPNTLSTASGTRLLYFGSMHVTDTNYRLRKLQFYPKTATGSVDVYRREHPVDGVTVLNLNFNDTIYLDQDLMAMAAAYMALSGDDLNAGAANMCFGLMNARYKDIIAGLASHDIPVANASDVPNYWQERSFGI